ncbi:MAG: hypothetical protein IPI23_14915 [Bacteroidetes bacterium]|nr:hypothetical protein [Bacteroidota bacterium]
MKFIKLILFSLVIFCTQVVAQRDYNWQLGHFLNPVLPKGGIDFSNGNPDTFSVFRTMPFWNSNSIICDTSGNLLFYTNGIYVANSNHDTLLNSNNFNPGSASTNNWFTGLNVSQSTLILPYPNSDSLYIIIHQSGEYFVINNFNDQQPLNLRYSMVDISLDNGMGGIVPNEKGIILITDTLVTGKMAACRHGNGRDWWVLTHKYDSDIFYRLLITPDTIVVDSIQIGSHVLWDFGGQAIFSPDGSKYALVTQNLLVDIFDFDRCTGSLSNHVTTLIPDTVNGNYGASISSNNRFLYVSSLYKIWQFDLFSANIPNSIIQVAQWDTVSSPFPTKFFYINWLLMERYI